MSSLEAKQLTPKKAAKLIAAMIGAKLPCLLVGAPGVGKTDLVTQAAKAANADIIIMHPVVSDPTDFKGMPWIIEKNGKVVAEFVAFDELQQIIDANKLTIVFLDDLGQATPAVQAACMQLILARRINGHKVSDNVVFMAASNRKQDKAAVSGILEPVKSRFTSIIEIVPDVKDWIEWALSNDISLETISFIQYKPEALYDFRPTTDMTNSPVPRTVVNCDKLFKLHTGDAEIDYAAYTGAAGESYATAFMGFLDVWLELPDLTDVIMNPKTAPVSEKLSVQCAVSAALARIADESNFEQILTYANRLRQDVAWFLVKAAVSKEKNHELTHTRAYREWAVRNQD